MSVLVTILNQNEGGYIGIDFWTWDESESYDAYADCNTANKNKILGYEIDVEGAQNCNEHGHGGHGHNNNGVDHGDANRYNRTNVIPAYPAPFDPSGDTRIESLDPRGYRSAQ